MSHIFHLNASVYLGGGGSVKHRKNAYIIFYTDTVDCQAPKRAKHMTCVHKIQILFYLIYLWSTSFIYVFHWTK